MAEAMRRDYDNAYFAMYLTNGAFPEARDYVKITARGHTIFAESRPLYEWGVKSALLPHALDDMDERRCRRSHDGVRYSALLTAQFKSAIAQQNAITHYMDWLRLAEN